MMTRSFLIAVAVLLFAQPSFAQFGQSNRLNDLAARLSRDAADFADATYNSYTSSVRNNRNEIEAVMLSQQFAASAQVFSRMVVDRRRNQELRDAFGLLQDFARSVERNNLQRNTWSNIQRSLSDLSRELNFDSSSGGGGQYPDSGRGGRMTWRGRVDDDVRIRIRGGTADIETIGGTPYYDAQPNFSASLPSRRVNVRLTAKRGRGEIFVEQQPSRENDFTAIVRIKDPRGGASDYEFELTW
jgi:type II secretory pathway pseudopilin PulG